MLLEWVAPVVGEEPIKDWLPLVDIFRTYYFDKL